MENQKNQNDTLAFSDLGVIAKCFVVIVWIALMLFVGSLVIFGVIPAVYHWFYLPLYSPIIGEWESRESNRESIYVIFRKDGTFEMMDIRSYLESMTHTQKEEKNFGYMRYKIDYDVE